MCFRDICGGAMFENTTTANFSVAISVLCVTCVQENSLMHKGHPCEDLYPEEYFDDGIINGAKWYNVAGMFQSLSFVAQNLV